MTVYSEHCHWLEEYLDTLKIFNEKQAEGQDGHNIKHNREMLIKERNKEIPRKIADILKQSDFSSDDSQFTKVIVELFVEDGDIAKEILTGIEGCIKESPVASQIALSILKPTIKGNRLKDYYRTVHKLNNEWALEELRKGAIKNEVARDLTPEGVYIKSLIANDTAASIDFVEPEIFADYFVLSPSSWNSRVWSKINIEWHPIIQKKYIKSLGKNKQNEKKLSFIFNNFKALKRLEKQQVARILFSDHGNKMLIPLLKNTEIFNDNAKNLIIEIFTEGVLLGGRHLDNVITVLKNYSSLNQIMLPVLRNMFFDNEQYNNSDNKICVFKILNRINGFSQCDLPNLNQILMDNNYVGIKEEINDLIKMLGGNIEVTESDITPEVIEDNITPKEVDAGPSINLPEVMEEEHLHKTGNDNLSTANNSNAPSQPVLDAIIKDDNLTKPGKDERSEMPIIPENNDNKVYLLMKNNWTLQDCDDVISGSKRLSGKENDNVEDVLLQHILDRCYKFLARFKSDDNKEVEQWIELIDMAWVELNNWVGSPWNVWQWINYSDPFIKELIKRNNIEASITAQRLAQCWRTAQENKLTECARTARNLIIEYIGKDPRYAPDIIMEIPEPLRKTLIHDVVNRMAGLDEELKHEIAVAKNKERTILIKLSSRISFPLASMEQIAALPAKSLLGHSAEAEISARLREWRYAFEGIGLHRVCQLGPAIFDPEIHEPVMPANSEVIVIFAGIRLGAESEIVQKARVVLKEGRDNI